MGCVVVLAGRRIDAEGAIPERFPARNRDLVCARVADRLRALGAEAVVASAACGADLIGHQAARALGIPNRVVLPFDASRFRESSVTDRPGDWGPVFDEVWGAARAGGAALVLEGAGSIDAAYASVNGALLDAAAALAGPAADVVVVIAWEGLPRGADDLTAHLADLARRRGWAVEAVSTRS